jgi:hypothetical protein
MRRLASGAALVCAALVVGIPSGVGGRKQGCGRLTDSNTHWKAVFGHVTSTTQAVVIRKALAVKGYRNIQFAKHYCDDVLLAVSGLDSYALRKSFATEGEKNDVQVTFDPPDALRANGPGEVNAVFGRRPTLKRANVLQQAVATKGYREYNDIIRGGLHDWKVIVGHVSANATSEFAAEARRAGFSVTFEP